MNECLEIDSVLKSYGDKTILTDVYLCCRPGDIIAIFGRNGSGKSTLLNIIFGTLKADRSFIRINGQVINKQAFRTGQVAYLPQYDFLPNHLSIAEITKLYVPEEKNHVFLGDRFLFKIRNSKIKELSGGELRYFETKLILYSHAPYLLLDEPFNGISPLAASDIRKYIAESAQTHGIIMVDHNYREVHKIANRLMYIDDCYLRDINNKCDLAQYGYYSQ